MLWRLYLFGDARSLTRLRSPTLNAIASQPRGICAFDPSAAPGLELGQVPSADAPTAYVAEMEVDFDRRC